MYYKTMETKQKSEPKKHMKVPTDVRIHAEHRNDKRKSLIKKRFSFHNK